MTSSPSTDPPKSRWRIRPIRITRDGILFALGIAVVLHELLIQDTVRPEFLLLATTLMGAVPFLQKGDKEADKRRDASPPAVRGEG